MRVPRQKSPKRSIWRVQECHCMLFLTDDNDFRGEDRTITLDEVVESTAGMHATSS
jgi:hypothetical protein